jgi:hypothetical protein
MQPLYATAYGNGYATAYGNGYATAYGNGYATAYGNGVSPPKIPRTAAPILKKG